jgi:hypothetical protein
MSGAMMRLSTVAGFLPNGEAIMHSAGTWGGHQLDSLNRSLATVVALDLATSATRAVATIPDLTGGEVETRYRGRRRTDWQPLRLGGSALVTVWDSVIATADPERSAIDLRDASGEIRSRIVVRRPGRAVTEPMRATRVELELARLSAPGSEGMVDVQESRRLARESPFADTLPRFSHLLTSSDGTLWAIDAIAPSDSGWSATAFRRDGAIVGRLFAPGRSTPLAFADDRIIVRSEDADGVVSIQVLAIRYASGASGDSDRGRPVAVPPP